MNLEKISKGDKFPEELNVVIEIPEGSAVKYELDKASGAVFVDRFMYTTMAYPFNYGFVPNTLAPDGDPADVLVLSSMPVDPASVIHARPVGMLIMEDEAGGDNKIVAVPTKKVDPFYAHVEDINDVSEATKERIRHFFEHYKELEPGKWVKVKGFQDKVAAMEELQRSAKNGEKQAS